MSEELLVAWERLGIPSASGELVGIRQPGLDLSTAVYLARDAAGRKHLLVRIPDGAEGPTLGQTRGLGVRCGRHSIAESPEALFIDLVCLDTSMTTTFASVADEIIRALQRVPTDPSGQVERCLERWHWFWSLDPASLSKEAALGLFAELWFLDRWLGMAPDHLVHWTGPMGSRHDFQREEWSVEVKASAGRGAGGPVHTVSSLEQLDEPVTGTLYLFSLQVVEDVLATNSLPRLVERIEAKLDAEGGGVGTFRELLAKSGYNPAHRDRYDRPLRIAAEELYRVGEGFPRLTSATFPSGLPPGVSAITYALSLAACAPWRVATTPRDAAASFLYSPGAK